MNYEKLNEHFKQSELNTAALLTCNFDPIAFGAIKVSLDETTIILGDQLIKHRKHLRPQGISIEALNLKFERLESAQSDFKGSADKPFGYVGTHLNESKSFYGTVEAPVSCNEQDYLYKRTWAVKAVNPEFQKYADLNVGREVFICTPSFDLQSLAKKRGVKSVTNDEIQLTGNKTLKVVIVE